MRKIIFIILTVVFIYLLVNKSYSEKYYFYPLGEILSINSLIALNNNFIFHEDYAKISFQSIKNNFITGFKWDDDNFLVNQYGHPYQGGLYFSSARFFKLSYWESLGYTFFGSLQWEYMMETQAPAINDLITTTLSGAILGEISFRLSELLFNNNSLTNHKFLKDLIAGILNPINGINKIIFKSCSNSHKNIIKETLNGYFNIGIYYEAKENDKNLDSYYSLLKIRLNYGKLFSHKKKFRPFDFFKLNSQIAISKGKLILHTDATGLLYRKNIPIFGIQDNFIGILQNFYFHGKRIDELVKLVEEKDIENMEIYYSLQNSAYKVGTTSIGGALLTHFNINNLIEWESILQFIFIPLGGVNSVYAEEADRLYNLGRGSGYKVNLDINIYHFIHIYYILNYFRINSLSGGDGVEKVSINEGGVIFSIIKSLKLGLEVNYYKRFGTYPHLPNVKENNLAYQSFLSLYF